MPGQYADWQKSYNQNLGAAQNRGTEKDVAEKTNVFGDIWGAFSGGQKDPIQSYLDKSQGDNNTNIRWQKGDEAVYQQMDAQQWAALGNMRQDNQRAWIEDRKAGLASGKYKPGTFIDPITGQAGMSSEDVANKATQDAAAQKEAAFQQWRQDTMTKLSKFADEMNMPVEQLIAKGDLGVQNAGAEGRNAAGRAAYGAGLGGGGISAMNTQRAVTDAQSKYQLQRAQIGLGATNSLLGNMSDMAHSGEDTRRYEQGMNLQMQQANQQAGMFQAAQQQQRQSALFGTIGGVAGGMYGGPMGASMGQKLGSGLGSYGAPQYQAQGFSYPQGNSTPGSGGGGLGGYRNGAQ